MEFEQVKELIQIIDSSNLAFFEFKKGNDSIKMDKSLSRACNKQENMETANVNSNISSGNTQNVVEQVKSITPKEAKKNEVKEEVIVDDSLTTITSPMVGTFYSKPSPDSDSFANEGDKVSKGKVICIIEAMKLMNEIESDYSGTIVKCLVKDGEMVEFGQPMFKIREE